MQSYTVVLSSYQIAGQTGFLNHYIFLDPVYGTNFTYPVTSNGSSFIETLCSINLQPIVWIAPYIHASYPGSGIYVYDLIDNANMTLSGGAYIGAFAVDNNGVGINNKQYLRTSKPTLSTINFDQNSFSILVTVSSGNPSRYTGSSTKRIVSKGHFALSPGYVIQVNQGGTVFAGIGSNNPFGVGNGSVYHQTLTPSFDFNDWNQIAVTYDSDTKIFNCYINGDKQYLRPSLGVPSSYLLNVSGFDLDVSSGYSVLSATSKRDLFVGGAQEDVSVAGAGEFFNGLIGDLKFFDRALTQDEIDDNRNTVFYTSDPLYYPKYLLTADSGLFFPWGYQKSNRTQNIEIGTFKGPVSLTFCPSAIDGSIYPILKLRYDYGDGDFTEVDKNIYGETINVKTNFVFLTSQLPGFPTSFNPTHEYWPLSGIPVLYSPSVSAIASDGSYQIFNLTLSTVPDSIYSISDFRLINNTDIRNNQKLIVSESKFDSHYLQNFVFAQNELKVFPTHTPTPTPTITPTPTPTPTITSTPTITPTPTVTPTPTLTLTPTPTLTLTPTPTPTVTMTPTPTITLTPTPTPTITCPFIITVAGAGLPAVNGTYSLSADVNSNPVYVKNSDNRYLVLPTGYSGIAPDITSAVILSGNVNTAADLALVPYSTFYASTANPGAFCVTLGSYDAYQKVYMSGITSYVYLSGTGSYPTVS